MNGFEYLAGGFLVLSTLWLYFRGQVSKERGSLPPKLVLRDQGRWLQGVAQALPVRALFVAAAVAWSSWSTVRVASFGLPTCCYLFLGLTLTWHKGDTERWLRNRLRRWFQRAVVQHAA